MPQSGLPILGFPMGGMAFLVLLLGIIAGLAFCDDRRDSAGDPQQGPRTVVPPP